MTWEWEAARIVESWPMILLRASLKEIGLQFGLVFAGLTFLVSLGSAIRASAASQGAPAWVTMQLVPLFVGNMLPYLLPVMLLVAVILAYGRMASDGEEIAMRAAGVHPGRLLAPALLAGVAVALLMLPIQSQLLPKVYREMREVSYTLRYAGLRNANPGASALHFGRLHVLWGGRSDGAFHDATVLLKRDGDDDLRLRADRAWMTVDEEAVEFRFVGLRTFGGSAIGGDWSVSTEGDSLFRIPVGALKEEGAGRWLSGNETSSALVASLESGDLSPRNALRASYAIHRRRALSLSAIPFALLGALLGWRLRRGSFLAAFAAGFGLVLTVFYPAFYLGDVLQQQEVLSPSWGAWLPVLALAPILLVLYRSRRLA